MSIDPYRNIMQTEVRGTESCFKGFKRTPAIMEPEGSSLCSHTPNVALCSEPLKYIPQFHATSL
jgi:hypothetical protein